MFISLPIIDTAQADIRNIGMVIQDLNAIIINSNNLFVDPSAVLDTGCFETYKNNRILSDQVVNSCLEYFSKLKITQVDMFLSVYKDCLIDSRPITVSVSYATIFNAIVLLYERWFDLKPKAKRTALHLNPVDTYPAILFQPHRSTEFTTITRHPVTGKLLQSGDGLGIVHCSKSLLSKNEEIMIKKVDNIISTPRKIFYALDNDGECIIRRTETYPMTSDAKVEQVLDKYKNGLFSSLKAISLIFPEDITITDGYRYLISAEKTYSGLCASLKTPVLGKAVFRWTKLSDFSEESIFLADELEPNDVNLLNKCRGAIFSRGGMTSHGAAVCRGLHIPCIVGTADLLFDNNNHKAFIINGNTINEGNTICIFDSQWSVGGSITLNDNVKAKISTDRIEMIRALILPYTDEHILGQLSLEHQFHISKLIRALRKSGWLS